MLALLLAGCAYPTMYNPNKNLFENTQDREYCQAIAEAYARPGIEPRLAAYKACMMERARDVPR